MIVWLWDAGDARGVSDDESRARQAASAYLYDGRAGTVRVERALLVVGGSWLTSGYRRTGEGWLARRRRNGRIRWVPLARTGTGGAVMMGSNQGKPHRLTEWYCGL